VQITSEHNFALFMAGCGQSKLQVDKTLPW